MLQNHNIARRKLRLLFLNIVKPDLYMFPHKFPNDLGCYETRKYYKNLKTSFNYILVLSISPKVKTLSILANSYWNAEIKFFPKCPISIEN